MYGSDQHCCSEESVTPSKTSIGRKDRGRLDQMVNAPYVSNSDINPLKAIKSFSSLI